MEWEDAAVSDKMECPGCGSYSSSTLREFEEEGRCGMCGLSADSAREILAVREKRGNDQLREQLELALKRAGKAEAERDKLARQLDDVRFALQDISRRLT